VADNPRMRDGEGNYFRPLTDEITSRNGQPPLQDGIQAQIVKLATGGDGVANDFDLTLLATDARLAAAVTLLTTQAGYLDGLETLLGRLPAGGAATEASLAAAVTLLTTQAGYLDGLETLLGRLPAGGAATEASLATLAGAVSSGVLKTKDTGTYGYAAGSAAASVDVPTGARIKRVSVVAGTAVNATVSILGGATITVLAGGGFDEQLPGDALATSSTNEIVIGGTVQSYYVAWVV
jgi:hypothetical protein